MSENVEIHPGDIIYIPSVAHASRGRVYLLGEVERRGAVPLPTGRDATLAKTLLRYGGVTKFGNENKVRIQRTAPGGTEETLTINVGHILETGNFDEDVPLRDGDVVIVPERLFGLGGL